ncbi:MAG: hypothetical protein ABF804_02715 [Liquorilactobacillus ghanensis]|uniref:hypothetical protein n=1 Tax=Liquorilactobacillus ghanensis TaxID=399370 RepID=UPI0039EA764D
MRLTDTENSIKVETKYLAELYRQLLQQKKAAKKYAAKFWFIFLIAAILIIYYPFISKFHPLLNLLTFLAFAATFAIAFYQLKLTNDLKFQLIKIDAKYFAMTNKHLTGTK